MAHPLNRPRYDAARGRVVEGYGILQPRVARQPAERQRARASRGCSAASRASIRTRAPSPTSTRTCSARARSSARASTTSTRSSARSAAASPRTASSATTCSKAATRAPACSATCSCTRTTRRATAPTSAAATAGSAATGRSLPWLLPRVPRRRRRARARIRCRALSHWKILDNLRRSLVPVALLVLLLLGWTCCAPALVWTLAVLGDRAACRRCSAALLDLRAQAARRAAAPAPGAPCVRSARQLRRSAALALACLPYEALYQPRRDRAHAVAHAASRHRRLLEWQTVERRAARPRRTLGRRCDARMWIAPGAGAGRRRCAGARAARRRWSLAAPVLLLWLASPRDRLVAQPAAARRAPRCDAAADALPAHAGAPHLAFFETFVGADDHWLPPDNFQEHPVARDRAPHLADQHRPGAAGEPGGLRLRLPRRRRAARAHRRDARHDGSAGAPPRPLLQLVRHADAASRCRRSTSRRSTAATSPATC